MTVWVRLFAENERTKEDRETGESRTDTGCASRGVLSIAPSDTRRTTPGRFYIPGAPSWTVSHDWDVRSFEDSESSVSALRPRRNLSLPRLFRTSRTRVGPPPGPEDPPTL